LADLDDPPPAADRVSSRISEGRVKQTGVGGILEKALPITVIVVVFLLGALALSPFLPALLWSVFISVALLPLYERAVARTGQRSGLATAAVALGLLLVVLLPMVVLLRAVIAVLPELAAAIAEGGTLATLGFDLPTGTPDTWFDFSTGIRDDLGSLRALIGDDLRLLVSSVMLEGRLLGHFVLEFLLGLVLATIILHNNRSLGRLATKTAERLGGARALDLAARSVLTIRYTVLGILGSAAVQTVMAALAYWIVGAPHWPLLAFATFLLGLLQIGPVLIWLPLCVWLWWGGQPEMATFLGLWGVFAVGLSDNAVKAIVVARGADLPTILVFLGAVGGLLTWGIIGIFLGPVILALCLELTLWWIGHERGPALNPDTPDQTP